MTFSCALQPGGNARGQALPARRIGRQAKAQQAVFVEAAHEDGAPGEVGVERGQRFRAIHAQGAEERGARYGVGRDADYVIPRIAAM